MDCERASVSVPGGRGSQSRAVIHGDAGSRGSIGRVPARIAGGVRVGYSPGKYTLTPPAGAHPAFTPALAKRERGTETKPNQQPGDRRKEKNMTISTEFENEEKFTPEISRYLSHIGRRGGRAKSARKAKSSAQNGKLGGRPKRTSQI